jgi:hypothetical protein
VSADATYSLEIGNLTTAGSFSYRGSLAWVGIWNTELTLAQIQALQFRRRVTSGCVGFWELGYNGTGTVPDWSGNANAGTNTSGTVTDHVPLPYRRGRGLWLPPAAVAAGTTLSPGLVAALLAGQGTSLGLGIGMPDEML